MFILFSYVYPHFTRHTTTILGSAPPRKTLGMTGDMWRVFMGPRAALETKGSAVSSILPMQRPILIISQEFFKNNAGDRGHCGNPGCPN